MSSRGKTIKYDTPAALTLLRPMITRRYELTADHEKCCGCRICATVCPREAITLTPGEVADGRMTVQPPHRHRSSPVQLLRRVRGPVPHPRPAG